MSIIKLRQTCFACPEQYDAYLDGKKVGYLRLRHGSFTVTYPDVDGELIYEASPRGDGIFDEDERDYYLRFAVDAIYKRIQFGPLPKPKAPDVEYEIEGGIHYYD